MTVLDQVRSGLVASLDATLVNEMLAAYVEAKEILGGFVILEAESMERAVEIASEWPSLSSQPNATVQVQPGFVRE